MNHDISQSHSLFDRALKRIPGGVNSPVRAFGSIGGQPFFTASAEGCHLQTTDGRTLIDFVGTWGPAIHGHNHPAIRNAISQALAKGTSFGTPNTYEVPMAELIAEVVPSIEKVRMVNSGTEATMSCIRLARGYTRRDKIIKFEGCYHGHSDALLVKAGSGALTHGHPDSAGVTKGATKDTLLLPFNDIQALESVFRNQGAEIAAVILEPYPANMGLVLPEKGFLDLVLSLAHAHGTLVIFDEVMSGFRVAPGGVQELTGLCPDLTALGKIIGGGLPVGAFGGRAEIMDMLAPLGPVYQAGTLSGNPMALAAGIASVELLREINPYDSLDRRTDRLCEALRNALASKGIPSQVTQAGSMLTVFFSEKPVRNYQDVLQSQKELFKPLFHGCLDLGLFLPPSPFEAWFVSDAHGDAVIDQSCEILTKTIATL
jgi:glutamate-1-semialdehyde 2,1-aminomutase